MAAGLAASACGSDSSGGVIPGAGSATLLDVQTQVFTPRCALSGCHTGTGAPFGLDLSSASASAANLVGVPSAEVPAFFRVEPYDAAGSYLLLKLSADPRILGDPMPASGGPLSAGQLAMVEEWIDEGAR